MNTCKTCGARILWGTTLRGRAIPLDHAPTEQGNLVIGAVVASGGRPVVTKATDADADRPHYTAHFATCPDADAHRKR